MTFLKNILTSLFHVFLRLCLQTLLKHNAAALLLTRSIKMEKRPPSPEDDDDVIILSDNDSPSPPVNGLSHFKELDTDLLMVGQKHTMLTSCTFTKLWKGIIETLGFYWGGVRVKGVESKIIFCLKKKRKKEMLKTMYYFPALLCVGQSHKVKYNTLKLVE